MTDNQSVLLVNSPMCRICHQVYQDPKILSCLHSFCFACLDRLHSSQIDQNEVTCPVCDVDTDIPPGGISSLTNNSFLKRISQDYIDSIKSTINKKPLRDTGFQTKWNFPVSPTGYQYGRGHQDLYKPAENSRESTKLPSEICKERTELSSDLKQEASKISEKLRQELMHLQGEALRTTYSIEKVNDTVTKWNQHNSEIKSKIQQRSAVLQHLIRRHETQLIAQLTNQQYTDKFLQDIETAKCGLKQNLKNILQAIEFIKQVEEFATDEDVLDMREFLLGSLAILNMVSINYKQYTADFQDTNIEHLIADDFGELAPLQTKEVVFDPKQSESINSEQEQQDKADEKSMPRRLRFRRKMNKERRLTSVVDKNWRSEEPQQTKEEPQQTKEDPVSNLRENLIQRRRNLLQEYSSFQQPDSSTFYMHQNVPQRPIKKKKRKYHSFGGRSTLSVAPPDAAMLRQINENIQITSEQSETVASEHSDTVVLEHAETVVSEELDASTEIQTDAASRNKLTTDKESPTTGTEGQAEEDEEWTVITEEVIVQQPPSQSTIQSTTQDLKQNTTQSTTQSTMQDSTTVWESTMRSVEIPQTIASTSTTDVHTKAADTEPPDMSDSEWTVTVEEVSVPQPLSPKIASHQSHSTDVLTNKSERFLIKGKESPQNVKTSVISIPQVSQKTIHTMTHIQQRPVWHQQKSNMEEKDSRTVRGKWFPDPEHSSSKVKAQAPNKRSQSVSAMNEELPSETDKWKVTTEEVPSDAFARSSVTQGGRETRLNFLRTSWRKRKEMLQQTEGFVAPVGGQQKIPPAPMPDIDPERKTEKSVHFKSNLGLNIRSLLNEEKEKSSIENKDTVMNGSWARDHSETGKQDEVFSDRSRSSRLTKDRLNEYRQNMRQKTERWRISSN